LAASYILDDIQDIRFKVKEELRSSLFSLKQLPETISLFSLKQLPEKIEDGDVSPVDLVEISLNRIKKLNPILNAFITVIEEQQYTGKLK
jgi:hypothetical protein